MHLTCQYLCDFKTLCCSPRLAKDDKDMAMITSSTLAYSVCCALNMLSVSPVNSGITLRVEDPLGAMGTLEMLLLTMI